MTDRRLVLQMALLAAGTAALPACGSTSVLPFTPDPTPDAQQEAEIALVAAYDAALASAGPAARKVYQRIRDEHAEHVRALGWSRPVPTPSSMPEPMSTARLVAEERKALRRHTEGARQTSDLERAQVLALIAASEAQHVVTLRSL